MNADQLRQELLPCPFCGAGETRIDEKVFWTGRSNTIISVTVMHWCPRSPLQSLLQLTAKTREEAIALWNRRSALDAAGEQESEPQGRVAGWKLVPVVGTEQMAQAWGQAAADLFIAKQALDVPNLFAHCYAALLAAAPEAGEATGDALICEAKALDRM